MMAIEAAIVHFEADNAPFLPLPAPTHPAHPAERQEA